ncbi:3-hydroxyacyl-ACP dehydratase FabZ [Dissulfurirhabdus thermomarina]|uniref:3-hydroxyacyl-[acyl-carrier-protein] dehydratase FabZ n=1 Tax=Dissulfurirhabdus thermomarina TaxID=1765737 RepID=A0A6N9TNF6_DISTH|nr:3-hydroxyacyl-ACP dehydratase FabZ [Dissulfurirhabdus thermomarina]NDY42785.1 3-hydroxyacyl-ACP dehydratase FabZ [Dissulfurirhabdus thermomarina]NMX23557.1 3-hydroxyacyl-ACP dehydratase FabZ [Dissulfurirhabdus thermomarina]
MWKRTKGPEEPAITLEPHEVLEILPHRYPFLLVDRVTEVIPGESIRAVKNVTANEPFFQGHFPGNPIMPGVLILEALAQAGIIFAKKSDPEGLRDKLFVFAGMDEVRFRKPVFPGDQLVLEATLLKRKKLLWKMAAKASVDGKVAAEAVLMAAVQA